MNFDFSDDLKQLRDQSRRFLSERCTPAVVRRAVDGQETYAADLWREIADNGLDRCRRFRKSLAAPASATKACVCWRRKWAERSRRCRSGRPPTWPRRRS